MTPSSSRARRHRRPERSARCACRHKRRSPARAGRPAPSARPADGPAAYSSGCARRTDRACVARSRARTASKRRRRRCIATPKRSATRAAEPAPCATPSAARRGAWRVCAVGRARSRRDASPWCRSSAPRRWFGMPALISDCAPMMLRVRPAQLTTTSVSGDVPQVVHAIDQLGAGAVDAAGDAHLAVLGQRPAVEDRPCRRRVDFRPSSRRRRYAACRQRCSTNSPNALLGTLTPLKSS